MLAWLIDRRAVAKTRLKVERRPSLLGSDQLLGPSMNLAVCTLDGVTYQALPFAAMPEDRIESLRYSLICEECRGRGYFKRAGIDGRSPCFGARHADGCNQATGGGQGWGDGGEGEQPEIPNTGAPIRIDLSSGGGQGQDAAGAGAGQRVRGRGRRFGGGAGGRAAQPTLRLRSILRALVLTDFGDSIQMIQPPNGRPMQARNYFLETQHAADVRHRNEPRGLWGEVLSVREANGVYWLNTGDRTQLSFVVEPDVMAAMLERFHLAEPEDIVGADILVLDRPRISNANKPFAKISGVNYVTLRFPPA